jgi:threonine/homoserine/homoserine lactone efflux protein
MEKHLIMLDFRTVTLFLTASFILAITPGPDILYVITRGMTQGKKAALAAASGFTLGNIVHTFFAVVGISAILKASAIAFTTVKLAGAIYLIYIGYKTFKTKGNSTDTNKKILSSKAIFIQSITANILNPKVAIFFLAFFPQFVKPENGNVTFQMIQLGLLFMLSAFIVFSMVGIFSGTIGDKLKNNSSLNTKLHQIAGCVLIGLGILLIIPEKN